MDPRWLSTRILGALLLYAPLGFGCVEGLYWRLLVAGLLMCGAVHFLFNRAGGRHGFFSRIPRFAPVFFAFLSLLALVSALNPAYTFNSELETFKPTESSLAFLPATYDPASTWKMLVHVIAFGTGALVALDVMRDPKKRSFLLVMIAVSGLAVAAIGIFQKATGAGTVLWLKPPGPAPNLFAGFTAPGAAAAYLNLAWPAAFALLVRALQRERNHLARALWANAALLTFAALFVNESRFGHFVALPGLLWAILIFRRRLSGLIPGRTMATGAVLVAGALVIAAVIGAERGFFGSKVEEGTGPEEPPATLTDQPSTSQPSPHRACVDMIAAEPLYGVGPGAFRAAFRHFAGAETDGDFAGKSTHARQDYLQLAAEWGLVAAAAWLAILVAAARASVRSSRDKHADWMREAALVALPILAIHALIDFPMQIPAIQLYAMIYLAALLRKSGERGVSESK